MKKSILVAALATAGVVNAAIVSSDVVGYKSDTSAAGTDAVMMTGSFGSVGSAVAGFTLADLRVTGYSAATYDPDWEEWEGGCGVGQFAIQELDGNGRTVATYYWVDNGALAAGWYSDLVGTPVADPSKVTFNPSNGLWVFGKGLQLVSAGAVSKLDTEFVTRSGTDAVGVANGTAGSLTLDDLTVTGYSAATYDPDWEEWEGGCGIGNFVVQKLNGNGKTVASYYWVDNGALAAGWYSDLSGTPLDATKVSFDSGDGFWVFGKGLTLNIPAAIHDED